MLGKILPFLRNPFVISLGGVTLAALGVVLGIFIQNKLDDSAKQKALEAKRAQEAAEYAAAHPQGPMPIYRETPDPKNDPLAPHYITLGDNLVINFGRSAHFIVLELSFVTRYGQDAEDLIADNKMALRAETMALLANMTMQDAKAEDARTKIQDTLKEGLNNFLYKLGKFRPIDQVLITSMLVQ
jgi:flagellar basal body-associated protein FliL